MSQGLKNRRFGSDLGRSQLSNPSDLPCLIMPWAWRYLVTISPNVNLLRLRYPEMDLYRFVMSLICLKKYISKQTFAERPISSSFVDDKRPTRNWLNYSWTCTWFLIYVVLHLLRANLLGAYLHTMTITHITKTGMQVSRQPLLFIFFDLVGPCKIRMRI